MIAAQMWQYKYPPEAPEIAALRTKINPGRPYHEYLKAWLRKVKPLGQQRLEAALGEKRLRDIRLEAEGKYRPRDLKTIKSKPDVPDVPIWR